MSAALEEILHSTTIVAVSFIFEVVLVAATPKVLKGQTLVGFGVEKVPELSGVSAVLVGSTVVSLSTERIGGDELWTEHLLELHKVGEFYLELDVTAFGCLLVAERYTT